MQSVFPILLIINFLTLIASCQPTQKDTVKVFILAGQSNMVGLGNNSALPSAWNWKEDFKKVWIYQGNPVVDGRANGGVGKWAVMQPGHGAGFASNGQQNYLSSRFGPELSFAQRLTELYPNEKIALIKYAQGGTSIDSMAAGQYGCWEPDYSVVNQYDNFLTTIKGALGSWDIDDDGKEDILVPAGIVWMQGESDAAFTEAIAGRYCSHLQRLMTLMRTHLQDDTLPIVIGKISDSYQDQGRPVWKHGELVQYAQEKYVMLDQHAEIVRNTASYNYLDPWHYDSMGYVDLGKAFAEAIYLLQKKR
ncbi:MAG: sialate O-acetylesterase [Aureispira sp.]